MASLTVAQITQRVQRQFGDTELAQVVQQDVYNWINDAMREIAVQNDLLQVQGSAAAVANQKQYALPDEMLKLRRVAYQGFSLRNISVEDADELVSGSALSVANGFPVGTPTHYWVYAGLITLFPAPSTSGSNDIQLHYTRQPTDVTSTGDTPELPAEYHNRIVEYCLAQAWELDMNVTMSQVKTNQFQQGIDKLKGNADWENQNFYPSIAMVSEYPPDMVGGWY